MESRGGGGSGGDGGPPDEQIKLERSNIGRRTQKQLNTRANTRIIKLNWLLLVLNILKNVQTFIFPSL